MLAKLLEARKGSEVIEPSFNEAIARLKKVESHLMETETLEGAHQEWLSGEFQNIEDC